MLLIFDLDGTLIDSAQDLAISVNAMREHLGLSSLHRALIHSYVGNGAAVLVQRALGPQATAEQSTEGLEFFLKFYRAHALEHTHLYDGIRPMLETLHTAGHTLAVLTNKPARISTDIVGALGLGSMFVRIYGGDSLPDKKPNPIGIATLMAETKASPKHTLMIGDTSVDIETAYNAGVGSCGVAWGFKPESFALQKPDFVIDTPAQLVNILREQAA